MLTQDLIDRVVSEKLEAHPSQDTLDMLLKNVSLYEQAFQSTQTAEISWIEDGSVFEKEELRYWDSYFSEEWLLENGFTADQLNAWLEKREVTIDEYKVFLRAWVPYAFENFDWGVHPIAATHKLQHMDGRHCITLISCTEGGQGGWDFPDVFVGLFKTQEDAIQYLKSNGIVDNYTEDELTSFIGRVSA